jgi:hypothetical protein
VWKLQAIIAYYLQAGPLQGTGCWVHSPLHEAQNVAACCAWFLPQKVSDPNVWPPPGLVHLTAVHVLGGGSAETWGISAIAVVLTAIVRVAAKIIAAFIVLFIKFE